MSKAMEELWKHKGSMRVSNRLLNKASKKASNKGSESEKKELQEGPLYTCF